MNFFLRIFATLTLLVFTAGGARADVVNGGFEAAPFLTGWNQGGVITQAGLNGSATAARLTFNTTATLGQTVAPLTNFTFDAYVQVAGNTTAQSFRIMLDSAAGNAIEMRGALGNIIQVNHGGQYLSVTAISGGATFPIATNSPIRIRVIGRNFGTATAEYDLAWSNPGSTTLVHSALALKSFVSTTAATTGSGVNGVRFDRNDPAAHSYWVDDVSLVSGAVAPPAAADYQVVAPTPPSGPVSLPYIVPFTTTAGAFAPAVPAEWSLVGGAYRNTITAASAASSASIQTLQLGGDPLAAPGFFLSSKFTVVSQTTTGNGVGFALFGTNATFTGGVTNPYYLVDFRPGANVLHFLRVGINNTSFLPDSTLQTMTVNVAQSFSLELSGTYETGVLRIAVTVRQGASNETFFVIDSEPLTVGYFGYRNRTGTGGALTVDCDDFTLRHLSTINFTATPAPFARPGIAYSSTVAAVSDVGATVSIATPTRPAWMNFEPNTLTGTPGVAQLGAHTVVLAATDTESGAKQQTFNVSVLEPTGVFISEFLAENDSGLKDEDGDQPDWIELFNSDSTSANVGGWWLTDDPLVPLKWAIPAGTAIPARSFLVVFASAKNRTSPKLHTNFKLGNAAGGYLALAQPGGAIVSSYVNYPGQRGDHSYGAYGSYTPRGYLITPTPGAPNDAVGYAGFVADTVFSVKRGFYTTPQNVSVTCATAGATLVYTTNGSVPTLANGTQSTSPLALNIASTTTLRVSAFAPGLIPSGPDTQSYFFLDDIRQQSPTGAAPAGWPMGPVNGQKLDYGMDPDITSTITAQAMTSALAALPTLSMVTDLPNLFDKENGIYVNPYGREEGSESPVSVELLLPDNTPAFQINAGLRIRGGASRVATNPKHNFHLYFRGEYGASTLKYPLFGDEGVNEFDRVDLRTTQATSWHTSGDIDATYNRDEWVRATHGAMGDPYTRSRYYHLYINGHYWGIYGTQERADSAFASSYFGGKKADYDVMKTYVIPHRVEAADGDNVAWTQLFNAAVAGFSTDAAYYAVQGLDATGQPNGTLPLLDVDNLIDYTLLRFFSGDNDAPVNISVAVPKNFFAIRPRDGRFGFRFLSHDAESTMISRDVTPTITTGNTLSYFNPRWLSQQLAANAKYRLRFADRVQKHFFNGGAVDNSVALARWQGFRAQLAPAMLAESARWGDAVSATPRTVANWNAANDSIETGFLATRRAELISQLRSRTFFPSLDAPAFSQHGGNVANGATITITAPAATTIYYTFNGTDPQLAGSPTYIAPVALSGVQARLKSRAKLNSTGEWSALTEALFTIDATPAAPGNLAITEIHYNPPGSTDDTEFVEILNTSASRVNLAGASFTGAMVYTFGNVTLEPSARILVVENSAAFLTAYGATPVVAGQWSGAFDNTTDTIILRASNGTEIERVTYADTAPWPASADGDGYTLVRINPLISPSVTNWRSSVAIGGNPGANDTAAAFTGTALADTDKDSIPALLEHFFATSDTVTNASPITASRTIDGRLQITFPRRLAADDLSLTVEVSTNLNTWTPAATRTAAIYSGTGTTTETWTADSAANAQSIRLRVAK